MFPYFNFAYKVKFNDATGNGPQTSKHTLHNNKHAGQNVYTVCTLTQSIVPANKERVIWKSTPPKSNTLC